MLIFDDDCSFIRNCGRIGYVSLALSQLQVLLIDVLVLVLSRAENRNTSATAPLEPVLQAPSWCELTAREQG